MLGNETSDEQEVGATQAKLPPSVPIDQPKNDASPTLQPNPHHLYDSSHREKSPLTV
jgi:hypothetical protein